MLRAELVSVSLWKVDIKIVNGDRMHVLQWRRHFTHDEVLLDGKRQQISYGFLRRERCYGLVFGRDEEGKGGQQTMLILDPTSNASGDRLKGVRLEVAEGPLIAYGSLDPKSLEKPKTVADWMKKSMGMEWGDDHTHRPH